MQQATATVVPLRQHVDNEAFRRVADALPQIVWVTDATGTAEYFNQQWYEYTRLDEALALGPDRWKHAYHTDDIDMLRTRWGHSLATGEDFDLEFRIRRHDGVYRWFLCRGQAMRNERGMLEHWFGTLTDIDDQKRAEDALRDQTEFLRSVLDTSTDCIKVLDHDGRIVTMNSGGLKAMEMPDFSFCEMKEWSGFWRAPYADTARSMLSDALSGKASHFEGQCNTYAGTAKWWDVTLTPIREVHGAVERVLVVSRDITEQRHRENQFRMLTDAVPQKVWVTRPDGYHEYFNKRWYDFTGVAADASKGEGWRSMYHPDDQERAWERWQHSVKTGEPYEIEYRLRRHDGAYRWMLGRAMPVRDENGTILRWFGTCTDIHDRVVEHHQLKQAIEQAEAASMAKTEFLANMSHEIRTPMNAVVGLANILSSSAGLTEAQREYVATLQVSAEQLLQLINDLLDVSRIESNGLHLEAIPFDLNRIVQEVVSINGVSAREKHIAIGMRGQCLQQLIGDPLRIKQVIMNLVGNAVKFTEEGAVNVNIFCAPRIGSRMIDLMIAVEDTGIGIDPGKVDAIFGKFSQAETSTSRRFGGSGLGLSIAKTLVELMGGQITVNSKPGKGSCFTVTLALPTVNIEKELPVAKPAKTPKATMTAPAPTTATKVLLVEDYHANVLVATMLLQNYGYAYELASSGEEAIKKLEAEDFAVVLMDVQMPQMNGYQATAVIREREAAGSKRTTIVGMTAHALKGDRERCIDAGMDDYIAKPFRPETLKGVLEKYCAPNTAQAD